MYFLELFHREICYVSLEHHQPMSWVCVRHHMPCITNRTKSQMIILNVISPDLDSHSTKTTPNHKLEDCHPTIQSND